MTVPLNEIEAMAKRAARGAGYPWGLAEEAGKATRWLCAHQVDGAASLARLLARGLAAPLEEHRPAAVGSELIGQSVLCPLITGALLSDRSDLFRDGSMRVQNLAEPALLLPFVAYAARTQETVLTLTAGAVSATTDGRQLSLETEFPAHSDHIEIAVEGSVTNPRPCATRATPDSESWATLGRFAHRTYAPATEESRLLGAGAGLSDND